MLGKKCDYVIEWKKGLEEVYWIVVKLVGKVGNCVKDWYDWKF